MVTGLIALSAMSFSLYHLSKVSSVLDYDGGQSTSDYPSASYYTPSAEIEEFCNNYCYGVKSATKYSFSSSYDNKPVCECLDDTNYVLGKISVADLSEITKEMENRKLIYELVQWENDYQNINYGEMLFIPLNITDKNLLYYVNWSIKPQGNVQVEVVESIDEYYKLKYGQEYLVYKDCKGNIGECNVTEGAGIVIINIAAEDIQILKKFKMYKMSYK